MNIGGLIAKILIVNAVSEHKQNSNMRWRESATNAVEQYYMSYFGEIFLQDERNWILNKKIKPMVSAMSDKQLVKVLSIRDKNNKLIKKNKPANTILVQRTTIEQYHQEYQKFLKEEQSKKEDIARRQKQTAEAEKAHSQYIRENGETNAEIIRKMF